MNRKELYEKRKANNQCTNCGAVLRGRRGKTLCYKCSDTHLKYLNASIIFYKEYGLCPRCGKNKLFGSEKNCPECRAQQTNYRNKIIKENPEYRENVRKNSKERYYYRKENHLCVDCGTPLEDENYVACKRCRIKRSQAVIRSRVNNS